MQRWIKLILDKPRLVIGIVALITVLAGSLLPRLTFDASIQAMIPDDDPVLAELRKISDDFGSQELFLIAIQTDNVFNPDTLHKIDVLTKELAALPGIKEVQTPLNAQLVESGYFGIEIKPVTTFLPQSAEEINQFRKEILHSPYVDRLITSDGRGAALLVDLENDNNNRNELLTKIEQIVESQKGPEEIYIVGDSYVFHYTEQAMKEDLRNLVPFVVLVIAGVLYFTFKSFLGILVPIVTVGASLIWTVALMILWGIPVSMISMVMPVILVTLGIASSIHILNKYQESLAKGLPKREALEETFNTITSPVIMAALTTAAGFGSLITAFVHPIREFGVLTALGVVISMGLSLTLVPAILILAKQPKEKLKANIDGKFAISNDGFLDKLLDTLTKWTVSKQSRVKIIVLIIFVVFGLGAFRLTLESNIINYFSDASPVKKGASVIEEVFGGSMQISVMVDTGLEDGIKEPDVLREIIVIQDYLNASETINHAVSIADIVRELNQALWEGDPQFYQIPDTREGVAQQLLLFSMQGGSGLDSLVSYDYSRALITAQMKTLDAYMLKEKISEVETFLAERYGGHPALDVRLIGTPKVMMRLMSRYVQTQISSLVTSIIGVGIIVCILIRSVALGLVSLVPLVFTVVLNFGIMGYSGIPLDAITSIIASLAIGIGIDYAIHYISRYRQELAYGQDVITALQNTGRSAGRGIFYNAIALIAGFLVLTFSHFRAISVFGYLIAVTMVISSLSALIVVPLLLQYISKLHYRKG